MGSGLPNAVSKIGVVKEIEDQWKAGQTTWRAYLPRLICASNGWSSPLHKYQIEKEDPVNRDYPTEVPVDEMMLRKCSYGAGMKEFTLIKPEHLLNGECFYAEKYPKGKATAHWAMKKLAYTK